MALLRANWSRHLSLLRWWGAAACVLAAIITIGGSTIAMAMPRQSTAAGPENAELTVLRTGPIGFGAGPSEFPLRIVVPGPSFKGAAILVDSAGLNQVTATSAAPAYCRQAERHQIATESSNATTATREWCLRVHGLEPGSEVTGTLSTQKVSLKLTLAVRDNYWFGPALVTLAAL